MLFSVVIPTYNRVELLKACLASVYAQTFTDYEVIVVDDGSNDGTPQYLSSLGEGIRVLRQKNCGPSAARNLAAANSRGSYLAFLDSDDLWFPWTLESFARCISEAQFPSAISCRLKAFQKLVDLDGINSSKLRWIEYNTYLDAASDGHYCGAGMLVVRRITFEKHGGFVTTIRNSEDHDLMLKLGLEPKFVQITEPCTLARRVSADGLTLNTNEAAVGTTHLISQEKLGNYPGGLQAAASRRNIITQHCRSGSVFLVKAGSRRAAWSIYCATFRWNATLGKWKYLLLFPILAAYHAISREARSR